MNAVGFVGLTMMLGGIGAAGLHAHLDPETRHATEDVASVIVNGGLFGGVGLLGAGVFAGSGSREEDESVDDSTEGADT